MLEKEKPCALLSAISLLRPGVAAHMVAAHLPEARLVLGHEGDPPDPLGALPEIEFWHHGAHGATMLTRDRLALPTMRQQYFLVVEVGEAQVRGVVVVAREHQKLRLGFGPHHAEQVPRRDALPGVVVVRPLGDAVDVRDISGLRLGLECRPVPSDWVLDQPIDAESPALDRNLGLHAEIEDRPVLDLALSRRQALGFWPCVAAGQQPALACPALFALDQLLAHFTHRTG